MSNDTTEQAKTGRKYRPRLRGEARTELVKQLAAEYQTGRSFRDLKEKYELSYGLTRRLVHESGVPVRGRGTTETNEAAA